MSPSSYAGSPTWVRTAVLTVLSISSGVMSLKENRQTNLKNLNSNTLLYLLLFMMSRLQGGGLGADPSRCPLRSGYSYHKRATLRFGDGGSQTVNNDHVVRIRC